MNSGPGFIPQRFNFAINKMFARIGSNMNTSCLECFLEEQLGLADTKHTFVTFNYDLMLESSIQKRGRISWDVKSGYGFNVERFITPEDTAEHMKQFDDAGAFRLLRSNQLEPSCAGNEYINILKPHVLVVERCRLRSRRS